jgi:hypothetical protein
MTLRRSGHVGLGPNSDGETLSAYISFGKLPLGTPIKKWETISRELGGKELAQDHVHSGLWCHCHYRM